MSQEIISAKITQNQIKNVKMMVSKFLELNPKARITPPKFGQLGDGILFSFKIDIDHFSKMLLLFLENEINVLFAKNVTGKTKELIDDYENRKREIETKKRMRDGDKEVSINEKKINNDKTITVEDVDKLIKLGDYSELIRISRSINCVPPVVEHAASNIKEAAQIAINQLEIEGLTSKYKAEDAIKKLLSIASDKNLLVTKDVQIFKDAGLAAINVIRSYKDLISELIKIANNNALHHSIVVEAIAVFSDIVFADEEFFKDDIQIALRSLSVRWLNIAYDVAHTNMSEDSKEKFNKLLDYILNKR